MVLQQIANYSKPLITAPPAYAFGDNIIRSTPCPQIEEERITTQRYLRVQQDRLDDQQKSF